MTPLGDLLDRIRRDLVEEASALPGQQLSYGRPHAHPRTRYFPRYSPTGEKLPGVNMVRPDCPRPVHGRCECPPDGTWRPVVGVLRADTTAQHATTGTIGNATVWVDEVYEQGPDGLWRCRWPMRRALERLRGSSVRRWSIAIRLLNGEPLMHVWGSHGAPPDPQREAVSILGSVERFAREEREIEWERRPRQWWDKPRQPNARSGSKSEAQANAEHEVNVKEPVDGAPGAATLSPTRGPLDPVPLVSRIGRGRGVKRSGQTRSATEAESRCA
jgi:hypothetical protein